MNSAMMRTRRKLCLEVFRQHPKKRRRVGLVEERKRNYREMQNKLPWILLLLKNSSWRSRAKRTKPQAWRRRRGQRLIDFEKKRNRLNYKWHQQHLQLNNNRHRLKLQLHQQIITMARTGMVYHLRNRIMAACHQSNNRVQHRTVKECK